MRLPDSVDPVVTDHVNTGSFGPKITEIKDDTAKTDAQKKDKDTWRDTKSGSFISNHYFLCLCTGLAAFTGALYSQLFDLNPYIDSQSLFNSAAYASSFCIVGSVMQELQNQLHIFNNPKTGQEGEIFEKDKEEEQKKTFLSYIFGSKDKKSKKQSEANKTSESTEANKTSESTEANKTSESTEASTTNTNPEAQATKHSPNVIPQEKFDAIKNEESIRKMQELRHEEQLKRQREQEEYDREMAILESQYQQKLQAEHDAELRAAEQLRNSQQSRLRQEKLQELRRQQDANQKLREEQRRLNLHKTSANEETSDSGKTRNLYEETYTYDESGTLREHKVLQDNRASHPSLQPQKPKLSTTGRTGQIVFTRDADGNLVAERTSYINKDGQQVDKLLNEQELDEETPTEKDFGTSGEIEEESSSESEESSDSNTDESGTESEDESELFTNVNNLASDVDQFINEQYYDRSFSIVGTPSGFNIDKVKYYYNKKPSTELIRSGEIPPIKSADRVYMDNMGTKGYYDVIQFVKNGVLHRKIEISESQKQCSDPDRDYLAGDETQQRPVASVQLEKDKYNLAAPTVQAQTQQSSTTPHTSTPVRKDPSAETIQRENKQFEDNFDEEAFAKKNPELFRAFEFSKKIGSVQEYNDVLHYYYDEKPVKSMPLIRGIIRAKDFTYNSKNYQAFDFQVNGRYYRKIDELPKKLTDHEVFMKVNIPCYGHNLNERQNKLLYFEDAMDKKWQDDDSRTVQISYVFEKIQPYQTDDEVYKFIDFEYDNGKRCRKVEKISRTEIPEFLLKSGLSELYNNKYIVLPMHKTSIYGDHRIHSKVKIEDNRGFNDKYMLLLHREHKDNEPHYYLKYAVKDGSGYYPYKKNK